MPGPPLCFDCKQTGRETKATRILNNKSKTPVCEEHYRQRMGIPPPFSTRPTVAKPAAAPIAEKNAEKEGSEETPMEKICGCGCGETLRIDNQTGFKTGHKRAGGGGNGSASTARAGKNGHFAVKLSAEGMDAVWNGLPAEKKAELLGHL